MSWRHSSLVVLVLVALLVGACGSVPTDSPTAPVTSAPTTSPTDVDTPVPATSAPEGPAEPGDVADPNDYRALGKADAPVTIIEYSDFQCPYCARYVLETFPQILNKYINAGQVRYEFRHFPLSFHAQGQKAAEAAECAGAQGAFWEMHDALFERQTEWSGKNEAPSLFVGMAGELGLDADQFEACLTGGDTAAQVQADQAEGARAGVSGTPAFFVNGAILSGAQPFSAFQQQIEYYLAGGQEPVAEVEPDSFRSMGDTNAPVVVTEFSDYQCPACKQVEEVVIPALIEQYVDTGKVRFVYRDFPLESLHPNAFAASAAAYCAGQQGKYWDMHQTLFANQEQWGNLADPKEQFATYASDMDLDAAALTDCLSSDQASVFVRGDMLVGNNQGVNATPYFFIGDLPIRGGLPIEQLGQIIDYVAAGGVTPNILPQDPSDWRMQGDPMSGSAKAIAIAFLNYADSESANHVLEVWPQLQETYLDTGQLVYVVHLLSDAADSPSAAAARAAVCAGAQDKFLELHTLLFENQAEWTDAADVEAMLVDYAVGLDLDQAQFEACLASEEARLEAQSGNVVAALYGVPGAPVFLFNNGSGEQGSITFEEFQAIIDSISSGQ